MRGLIRRTVLTAAVCCALGAPTGARGATILVRPGRLDHFVITAPPTALAGEGFLVRIEPYDANNNLITEFRGKGGTFGVSVSGGEVSPARLRAEEFAGGATVKVADKRAETLELAVTEGEAATPLASVQVRVLPNRLDRFVVNTPREATAGEAFQARVIAQDAFGNTKTDLGDIRESLRVDVSGTATALLADKTIPAFRGGETIISFQPRKSGALKVAVQENRTRAQGEGPAVTVNPGLLHHFTMLGPKAAVAGEKFVVLVAAFDAYENVVTNYAARGEGLAFIPSGTGVLAPVSVPVKEFHDGQARVTLTYTRAEAVRITGREQNGEASGQSEAILVQPADPDHFRVTTPAEAVAGEGFQAQIEALDRFDNLIEDYDLRGLEVYLSADGRGTLTPAAVSPASFLKGKAAVTLSYNRAESFTVIAALSKEALEKLVAERKKQAAAPPEPVLSPEEVARERERAAAAKAREEAQKAKDEAEKKRSREEAVKAREEAAKAREEAQKAASAKAAAEKSVAPAPKASEKPTEKTVDKPAEKTVDKPAEKTAPARTAAAKPAAKAPTAPAPATQEGVQAIKAGVKILEKISLEESPGQALVKVAVSGPVSYSATTTSELSKEWVWLELFPVRLDPAVGESVAVQSAVVGQILVKQTAPDRVRVSLQVLPSGFSYVVTQADRSVVVKVLKTE
jgi:hypothetical protein